MNSPMFPHLSLFYIDDAQAEDRARIAKGLQTAGHVVEEPEFQHVRLIPDPSKPSESVSGFEIKEIWVVMCEGKVEEWNVIEKFDI